jgi:phosphoserine phosphatase
VRGSLAVFDVDGTLVRGDCGALFALFCAARGLLTLREIACMGGWGAKALLGRIGQPEVADAKRLMLRFSARLGEARFAESYDECFRRWIVPRLRNDLREELEALRTEGAVVLVTANLRDFAVRLGAHLGIPASHCFGAVGARRDGALTGELAEPVPMSEVRARLVRGLLEKACIPRERTCAFGDSIYDAPMLREVGRPCAVYPSRALRSLARASGWRIVG